MSYDNEKFKRSLTIRDFYASKLDKLSTEQKQKLDEIEKSSDKKTNLFKTDKLKRKR